MPFMPWLWDKLKAVAHTLPYDAQIMTDFRIPRVRFSSIRVPVLMMDGIEDAAAARRGAKTAAERRSRRPVSRAWRADAQRRSRDPGTGGREVPGGAMKFIIMHATDAALGGRRRSQPRAGCTRRRADWRSRPRRSASTAATASAPSSEGVRLNFAGRRAHRDAGSVHRRQRAHVSLLTSSALRRSTRPSSSRRARRRSSATARSTSVPSPRPWEIGFGEKPANLTTRRYMVQRKATPATEAGAAPTPAQRSALAKLVDASTQAGVHLARHTMRPSSAAAATSTRAMGSACSMGRSWRPRSCLSGFMIIEAESLDDAGRWTERYLDVVESPMVDVRELE